MKRWIVLLACLGSSAASVGATDPLAHADFGGFVVSRPVRESAGRVISTNDNHGQPFIIVDKVAAQVVAFDATGHVLGISPALLGLAIGDTPVAGTGTKKLRDIPPQERMTPAGRFEASLDKNLQGHDILWVDYDAAISLHAVVPGTPLEERARRLASPSAAGRRISYGCINVPDRFFRRIVVPMFQDTDGIVYVLPEMPA